ncbi:MAG: hypothetical protein WCR08_05700 [Gammaproteobacteria bacterium]|jgi:hypothetical protein|nr:MAG: hypothetical protein CK423_05140 [Legionella sp.]
MAKTKKTTSDKEQEYLKLIEDTKNKLKKLQSKKKIELGELAHKCGLGDFDLKELKFHFQKIAKELSGK